MSDIEKQIEESLSGEKQPCPVCGRDVDSGWVGWLLGAERDKHRQAGLRAALEAGEAESQKVYAAIRDQKSTTQYVEIQAAGAMQLAWNRAIERLLEEAGRGRGGG